MDYMTTYYSQSGSNHNLVNLPIDVFFFYLKFSLLKIQAMRLWLYSQRNMLRNIFSFSLLFYINMVILMVSVKQV